MAMMIVGSSVVVGKIITDSFPLFLASGLRFGIAALLLTFLVSHREKALAGLGRKDWITLILMAVCGQFLFTLFLLWGLRMTSAAEAGVIMSTTPAAMAVVSCLLLRERLTLTNVIGVALAVLGILAVNGLLTPTTGDHGPYRWLGNLLVCSAVMGEAMFLLLRKKINPSLSSLSMTCALCLIGFLIFLPPAIYQAWDFDFSKVRPVEWGAMLYFGVVFTVVAYVLWFRGVARVPGSTAGIFTAIMPVSAVVLSYIFLGEPFCWSHVVGGVLVVSAIGIMALQPNQNA